MAHRDIVNRTVASVTVACTCWGTSNVIQALNKPKPQQPQPMQHLPALASAGNDTQGGPGAGPWGRMLPVARISPYTRLWEPTVHSLKHGMHGAAAYEECGSMDQ